MRPVPHPSAPRPARPAPRLKPAALLLAVAGLLAAACLLACVPSGESDGPPGDGPSTETGNPALAGKVRDAAGAPAGGARVLLLRLPGGADSALRSPTRVDSAVADADGAYRFDSLAAGAYAVLGSDDARGLTALLPRAEVPAGDARFLRRDTLILKRPGSLAGFVRRDDNPKPAGVIANEGILARVAGTERAAYTDTAGRYVLEGVPEGLYRVAFAAADGHYLPGRIDSVAVAAGSSRELPAVTLAWSPVAEPPAPDGLSVRPDSAAGLMRLAWRPVRVSNFSHYEVVREVVREKAGEEIGESAPTGGTLDAVRFRADDTVFVDTVAALPAGTRLGYRVLAVNLLGVRSPEDTSRGVPVTVPPAAGRGGDIALRILLGSEPAEAVVRLYAIPAGPGPEDSLPRRVRPVDSLTTAADGLARFAGLPAGPYTAIARSRDGALLAARVGLLPGAGGRTAGPEDTLRLAAPGRLTGTASRRMLWCSHSAKQDEDIAVSLAGAPLLTATDFDGSWSLSGVPAGSWRVVIQASPPGCFLPDTAEADVPAGGAVALPAAEARPNPAFVPKLSGLRLVSAAGGRASLEWNPVPSAYPDLLGYEVVRRDREQRISAASEVIPDPRYVDDVSALPSGSEIHWLVRAVSKSGARGPFGGDAAGLPLYFTVP